MSCYKCGKELPPGQVECEEGCGVNLFGGPSPAELEAEAMLARELINGAVGAALVARHLMRMGAASGKLEANVEGRKFLIFVKEL
jgi:hypothetical protein